MGLGGKGLDKLPRVHHQINHPAYLRFIKRYQKHVIKRCPLTLSARGRVREVRHGAVRILPCAKPAVRSSASSIALSTNSHLMLLGLVHAKKDLIGISNRIAGPGARGKR